MNEPTCYRGDSITSEINQSKPEPGVCHTLSTDARNYLVNEETVIFENHPQDSRVMISEDNIFQSLTSRMGTGGGNTPMVKQEAIVRRLTPLECERLQGFPDYWTDIGEWTDTKGKKHKTSDGPRLKALGNSIGLPFWEWMAGRMVKQLKDSGVEEPTMASLFDGIGGFPLVYERNGCKAVWASEIEEFPIAVTKYHFKED